MYAVIKTFDNTADEIGTFHTRKAAEDRLREDFICDRLEREMEYHPEISEEGVIAGMDESGAFDDGSYIHQGHGTAYLSGRGGTEWRILHLLHSYYFSFGTDPKFPFQGGWVRVDADNKKKAIETFRKKYPDRDDYGTVNCAFIYTADQWRDMNPEKNWKCAKQHKVLVQED